MSVSCYSRHGVWRSDMNSFQFDARNFYVHWNVYLHCASDLQWHFLCSSVCRGFPSIFVGFSIFSVRTFLFPCLFPSPLVFFLFFFAYAHAHAYAHAGFLSCFSLLIFFILPCRCLLWFFFLLNPFISHSPVDA